MAASHSITWRCSFSLLQSERNSSNSKPMRRYLLWLQWKIKQKMLHKIFWWNAACLVNNWKSNLSVKIKLKKIVTINWVKSQNFFNANLHDTCYIWKLFYKYIAKTTEEIGKKWCCVFLSFALIQLTKQLLAYEKRLIQAFL